MKTARKKPVKETILWGIISLAAYIAVFTNQETVTAYFTRGGISAIAIIATALLFSFVYGAFASYFLELVGIEPAEKH
jgi:hypothetical protein